MSDSEKRHTLQRIHALATGGEFVVAVAAKTVDGKEATAFPKEVKAERLSFRGLITLRDPIRPGVAEAIRRVEHAGIRDRHHDGDHRGTAEAIAREVGLPVATGSVLDAAELRGLGPDELKRRLATLRVISRVSPLDKMMIVKTLQEMGEVVAMTGDGVNDAPSIRQADIGIAMGSGTEVSRDVADLVLLDDNFETIVAAVEEGRQILKNIRKVLVYLLSSVFDELLLIGGALAVGLPLPLNALQILYVNFFLGQFSGDSLCLRKRGGLARRRPERARFALRSRDALPHSFCGVLHKCFSLRPLLAPASSWISGRARADIHLRQLRKLHALPCLLVARPRQEYFQIQLLLEFLPHRRCVYRHRTHAPRYLLPAAPECAGYGGIARRLALGRRTRRTPQHDGRRTR